MKAVGRDEEHAFLLFLSFVLERGALGGRIWEGVVEGGDYPCLDLYRPLRHIPLNSE